MGENIIGIVPHAALYADDIPHRDLFLFANPYVRRLEKHGAVPLGILPGDAHAREAALSLCDGFLLSGGKKIWPYHLQIVAHANRTGKPLLGICLGMQAISAYCHVRAQGGDLLARFDDMKRAGYMFTYPVAGHALENVRRESMAGATHPVEILAGTRLHAAMGRTCADAVSLHAYKIAPVTADLAVSAVAPDGTVEGIELGTNIVGVQFHPEVDDAWDGLFAAFLRGFDAEPRP